jgi:4-methylaminobutanoate oxidase (formaldehyde-forming)
MRIEKGYLSYGHDLDTDLNPLEAGLGFAVAWDTEFLGKTSLLALRSLPLEKQIVTILLDDIDAVPLGNEPVLLAGKIIGKTTSAAFGYRVGRPVVIALLQCGSFELKDDLDVDVDIAGELFSGKISLRPAYDPDGKTMRPTGKPS